jgi:hypothetical protein
MKDNTDIVLLLRTCGRSQTLAAIYFLATLEDAIRTASGIPTAMLGWGFDITVGYLAGAIPAVIMALGINNMRDIIPIVAAMQTVRMIRGDPEPGCGLCRTSKKLMAAMDAQNTAGARSWGTTRSAETIVSDRLMNNTQNQVLMADTIGLYTSDDLVTRCEVPGVNLEDGLVEAILRAAAGEIVDGVERHTDLVIAGLEVILRATAVGGATLGSDDVQRDVTGEITEQWLDIPTYSAVYEQNDPTSLRDELTDGTRVTRNTLIMTLSTRSYSGGIPFISSTSRVEQARNGMEVVALDVGITIPAALSKGGSRSEATWRTVHSLIENAINGRGSSNVELSIRALVTLLVAEITRAATQVGMADTTQMDPADPANTGYDIQDQNL